MMPKLNLEDDDSGGVGRVEEFTWKSLLDTYACTECARCSNYCPAYNTGKPLSPMQLIHDIRDEMRTRMPDRGPLDVLIDRFQHGSPAGDTRPTRCMPLIGGRIAEDALWACTTCGACQEVCPVFIEHPLKILQMRQNLVLEQEKVPAELARTFPTWNATQPVGHRRRQAHGLGRGPERPDAGGQARRRVSAVGRLRRRVRRPHQEADARAGRDAARGRRRLRRARAEEGAPAIRRGAPATRCCIRCRRSRTSRRSTPRR